MLQRPWMAESDRAAIDFNKWGENQGFVAARRQ